MSNDDVRAMFLKALNGESVADKMEEMAHTTRFSISEFTIIRERVQRWFVDKEKVTDALFDLVESTSFNLFKCARILGDVLSTFEIKK